MEKQRQLGREHWKGSGAAGIADVYKELHNRGIHSHFIGYDALTGSSHVLALIREGVKAVSAAAGDRVDIVVDTTPFYGESGGQSGDVGTISTGSALLEVFETSRPFSDLTVHHCNLKEGAIRINDAVKLTVTSPLRMATARNHTATHLLQTALRKVLGDHIKQAGSLVMPDRLRFDFTHFSAMTADEIRQVEALVNDFIMINDQVSTKQMAINEAVEAGATALFDEKYGDTVRVVRVGDVSMELCGGTHVRAAGDIGLFKIVSEAGIAAGVRRIEALTGAGALAFIRQLEDEQRAMAALLKAESGNPLDRLEKLLVRHKDLQREIETLQGRLNAAASGDLLAQTTEVNGVKLLSVLVSVEDVKGLRDLSDTLKDRLGEGVIVLGAEISGKANLLVAVSKELSSRIKAGDIIRKLAPVVGGSGGGKPELAQAGGSHPERLSEALALAAQVLAE
jgi:alanyl-tRNA synthetase